jgi:hypothetical protein
MKRDAKKRDKEGNTEVGEEMHNGRSRIKKKGHKKKKINQERQ